MEGAIRAPLRRVRLPRGDDPGAGVRGRPRPRPGGRAARRVPALRRPRPRAGAAPRPDDPGRRASSPPGWPTTPGRCACPTWRARSARRRPAGRAPSEERQAGVELVGDGGPGADAEVLALLVESLRADRRPTACGSASGDVSLTARGAGGRRPRAGPRAALGAALAARNVVEWRRLARAAGAGSARAAGAPARAARRGGAAGADRRGSVPRPRPACERLGAGRWSCSARHGVGDAVRDRPRRAPRLALLLGDRLRGVRAGRRRAGRHGRALRRPGRPLRPRPPGGGLRASRSTCSTAR